MGRAVFWPDDLRADVYQDLTDDEEDQIQVVVVEVVEGSIFPKSIASGE